MIPESPRVCLFGAAPDTQNLGVSALFESIVVGLTARLPGLGLTVYDHGRGQRSAILDADGRRVPHDLIGARLGHRYHLPENLRTMRLAARLGGLGNAGARALRAADLVLDISGGDSFTDLYGPSRFAQILLPKTIALEQGIPLVLLPQTYGPFRDDRRRQRASQVVSGASMAWARDVDSFAALRDLLGQHFDPSRHRLAVDMAFALPPTAPSPEVRTWFRTWRAAGGDRQPVVGLNVSGLLHGRRSARDDYGLRVDYRSAMRRLLVRLVDEAGARVVLVPHVFGPAESDVAACRDLAMTHGAPRDVTIVPAGLDAGETKWIISQLDWFCGTRMHATIAALSSGVPAAAVAYSPKTEGVFATVGLADHVADARRLDDVALVDAVWASLTDRTRTRARLHERLPDVLSAATSQLDELARTVQPRRGPVGVSSLGDRRR